MSDVLHDSPTELLHEIAGSATACVAQSVIPDDQGGYTVACSCEQWEVTAATREEGLNAARRHTGSAEQ
jgi:hypothetical protein